MEEYRSFGSIRQLTAIRAGRAAGSRSRSDAVSRSSRSRSGISIISCRWMTSSPFHGFGTVAVSSHLAIRVKMNYASGSSRANVSAETRLCRSWGMGHPPQSRAVHASGPGRECDRCCLRSAAVPALAALPCARRSCSPRWEALSRCHPARSTDQGPSWQTLPVGWPPSCIQENGCWSYRSC